MRKKVMWIVAADLRLVLRCAHSLWAALLIAYGIYDPPPAIGLSAWILIIAFSSFMAYIWQCNDNGILAFGNDNPEVR